MKRIALFLILCAGAVSLHGQGGYTWGMDTRLGSDFNKPVALTPMEISLFNGYRFGEKVTLGIPITLSAGLFNDEGQKTYDMAACAGLALLWTFGDAFSCAVEGGASLGGSWEYAYGDIGLRWHGLRSDDFSVYFGFGTKGYIPYDGSKTRFVFYGTVGFRITYPGR